MREATGDLWTWDDGNVVARVTAPGPAIRRYGAALTDTLEEYDARWGYHLHSFRPKGERSFWLLVMPGGSLELTAAELLHWTLGMLDGGTVVVPPELEPTREILDQPVLFQGEREARSIGDRFCVVHP